ncbi:CBS domain-containing protein [Iamia sp. SCSIO 61187]|uniref:CBS domain-containing protein n=1 Tax=Iamia sp. SCSIO 61187 TaxID=2722752 RepID=UPI001C633C15|nr:CBS domain-containing protein [Iamia sp. SCSIO 61187]QYG93542.1 CBS domain-containing protein [Iamia sp. SCSIO 61187]
MSSDTESRDTERRVGDLVTAPPVVVGEDTCLRLALLQLEEVGAPAAVVGHTRNVAGIVSEHDLARALAHDMDLDATPVHAVMTPYFASLEASSTVEAAQRVARSRPMHVLAVTDDGTVVGLVTTEAVLREPVRA